jgi:hypothetical protein
MNRTPLWLLSAVALAASMPHVASAQPAPGASAGATAKPGTGKPGTKQDKDTPPPPPPPPEAKGDPRAAAIKAEGDTFMDQKKYADAYARYRKAYEISGDPALLYNQGRMLEAMGEYPDALDKIQQFKDKAPKDMLSKVPALDDLIKELNSHLARLEIGSKIEGAKIFVRKKEVGKTGGPVIVTSSGPADIEVDAENYAPFKKSMDLPGGKTTHIDATYTLPPDVALIGVRTNPPAGLVFIDGKAIGASPIETRVEPGSHEIVARLQGYEEKKVPLSLGPAEGRTVDVRLDKEPEFYQKWWFWTGAAVVVAAGAGIATALLVEKPLGAGTLQPGQVRTPLTIQFR